MTVVGRRVLAAVPVMFGVSVVTFFVLTGLPGDAAQQLLGSDATPERAAELRAKFNLTGSSTEQYLEWLSRLLKGDLGASVASGLPVSALLRERAPVTLQLLMYALLISVGLAVPVAVFAARRPLGLADRLCTIISVATLSVPSYVFAVILVFFLAISLPLFPSIGFTPIREGVVAHLSSLTLPALAIALPLFGLYAQFLHADLRRQQENEAYVMTAMAAGIAPWRLLVRHTLPNALFGLLTLIGLHIGTLISSVVIIEQIFVLPGVGQLLLQAVNARDFAVVQGIVLVLAFTTILANLVVDILYAVLDPRVHYRAR